MFGYCFVATSLPLQLSLTSTSEKMKLKQRKSKDFSLTLNSAQDFQVRFALPTPVHRYENTMAGSKERKK